MSKASFRKASFAKLNPAEHHRRERVALLRTQIEAGERIKRFYKQCDSRGRSLFGRVGDDTDDWSDG